MFLIKFNKVYVIDEDSAYWERYILKKSDPDGYLLSVFHPYRNKITKNEEFIPKEALIKVLDIYLINRYFMTIKEDFIESECFQGEYLSKKRFNNFLRFFYEQLTIPGLNLKTA